MDDWEVDCVLLTTGTIAITTQLLYSSCELHTAVDPPAPYNNTE